MRAPRALLTLVTISACGGSNDGGSASLGGQPSDPGATTEAAETGAVTATTTTPTTTPTTTDSVTDTEAGTETGATPTTGHAPTTGHDSTGEPDTGTTATSDTGTTAASSTSTDATTDTTADPSGTTDADTGSTGPGCPEGQAGCPCGPGDACDPGLACQRGLCGPAPTCGDGELDPGEACDDGNQSNDDACTNVCALAACGDGFKQPGEQCDQGGANSNTGACTLACKLPACGDGFVQAGEQCDDGNQVNGDGCEKTCVKTPAAAKDACGFDTDGVWFQIDYSNANTVSSPSYSYSPTPGWGEAQWAPAGKNWPYAVDLFNNASVVNDQIGKVALLNGTNKAVRVYFGLVGLNYTYATVCVEGRSYSVGSSVTFLVQEAKTKCGDYGSMANNWVVHATGVDLQDCFIPGDSFQAVQVQPSGGSGALSLKRLRVTLHGATY